MNKIYTYLFFIGIIGLTLILSASEQGDGPMVAYTSADIADFYAFRGETGDESVFLVTLQSPLSPGSVTQEARFDSDVMIEFNIDNDGDFKEDLVIQAIPRDTIMYFFGPSDVSAVQQGQSSEINISDLLGSVTISNSEQAQVTQINDIQLFAGPRRDPFFFDQERFKLIQSGSILGEGFNSPNEAVDAFDHSNVLTVAISLPTTMLGQAPNHVLSSYVDVNLPNSFNVWVSTNRKY